MVSFKDRGYATSSEREKATLEQEYWATVQAPQRKEMPRSKRLLIEFGGLLYNIESRHVLLRLGDVAAPLWDRVEAGRMSYHQARQIVTSVRNRSRARKELFNTVLTTAIAEFDSFTPLRRVGKRPTAPLLAAVKERVLAPLQEELEDLPEDLRSAVLRDLEGGVKILVRTFKERIRREKTPKLLRESSRSTLAQACHTLAVDVPKIGELVDLKKAKANRQQLARRYHTDTSPDAPANLKKQLEARFHEVIGAYETLREYNERLSE